MQEDVPTKNFNVLCNDVKNAFFLPKYSFESGSQIPAHY